MYFSQFPKIYYDFAQDNTSTSLQILTDITTNVRVRKEVLENITLYDEYDMMDGETPEIVAEKVYGNPELHWVIMLVNQRYDYIQDFPMSFLELEEYVNTTYGAENIYNVHHYEKDGIIVEGQANLVVPLNIVNLAKVNDFITDGAFNSINTRANARIQSIDKPSRTLNLMMDYGRFETGRIVNLNSIFTDTLGVTALTAVASFTVGTNAFSLDDGYIPITNYEYEIRRNESKRTIKLISSQLVNQFVTEYMSLVTPT
jgi:hypothetical protein